VGSNPTPSVPESLKQRKSDSRRQKPGCMAFSELEVP
jgi:hypothetical protein